MSVPLVDHPVSAVAPEGCSIKYGNVVVPEPPVNMATLVCIADTEAAGVPVTVPPPLRLTAVVAVVAVVAALAVHAVQVPVRLVITPDAGVPSAGVTNTGDWNVSPLGKSAFTNARHVGAAAAPVVGPAKKQFAA